MRIEFKHQEDYVKLTTICPPSDYASLEVECAYRWVFETIDDARNFQTQYHKNPKRFLKESDQYKCEALALSFFNNFEGAIERFNELKTDLGERISSVLGTHLAKGSIKISDGVNSEPGCFGHFNHHTSDIADYTNFNIIHKL